MGVGYAEDLVVSVALGADLFDCVYPTRTAVSITTTFFFIGLTNIYLINIALEMLSPNMVI